jgi:hypothetical protein
VNFAAHIVVAHRAGAAPLSAAAPDLAHMARLPLSPAVDAGHHHRADAAFHELAWFRSRTSEVTRALTREGVRRGPARGGAHVLVELLLDGAVLGSDRDGAAVFDEVWASLGRPDPEVVALVEAEHRQAWADFLDQVTRRLDPYAYADPAYAADRAVGTLSRRPRLAMDDDEHAVLRALAQPIPADEASDVLRQVTEQVVTVARDASSGAGPRTPPRQDARRPPAAAAGRPRRLGGSTPRRRAPGPSPDGP